jgi:predicted Zn-ribbon and HTH transcriptional regulator
VFSFTQNVLTQLLSIKNSNPERLSQQERSIADRICHCGPCGYLWVRKFPKIPDRCPHCHVSAWDRPLLTAILNAQKPTTTQTPSQATPTTEGPKQ